MFHRQGRIFRVLTAEGARHEAQLRQDGALARLEAAHLLIASEPAQAAGIPVPDQGTVLEHPTLPVITYPYEWSFGALRAAALHHLDLQISALDDGVTLTDASAYNVQFEGTKPLFIDVSSLRPREPNEYWSGYRQFREEFLNPLALTAYAGLPFNPLYKGSIAGIDTGFLRRVLPLRHALMPMALLHIALPELLSRRAEAGAGPAGRGLSGQAFQEILNQLRRWIAGMKPRWQTGHWSRYATEAPYAASETALKQAAVERTIGAWAPARLLDLGCNTGAFALAAHKAGAKLVVGIDSDAQAADLAYSAARDAGAAVLPLVVDIADPSPARGWRGQERRGLIERVRPDAVMALAVAHHVAVSGIPLPAFLDWVVEIAPRGIVEFVPPDDPMLAGMIASRGLALRDYSREAFLARLGALARVERCETLTESGRLLAVYDRG